MITEDDLKICRALVLEADDIRHRLDVLKAQIEGKSPFLSWAPGGTGTVDNTGRAVCNIDTLERLWGERIAMALLHVTMVEEALWDIPKPEARMVMRLYYIDGLTWEQVEAEAHYGQRQCRRLRDYALVVLGIV